MTIAEVADRVWKVRAGYGAQVYGLQEGDRAGLSGQYQSDATLLANNCLAACQAVADLQDDQMPSDPVQAIGYLVDLNAEAWDQVQKLRDLICACRQIGSMVAQVWTADGLDETNPEIEAMRDWLARYRKLTQLPVPEKVKTKTSENEELTGLLRVKYRKWAAEIIAIVKEYKTDKAIVEALKRAGIVAMSSYGPDIKFYKVLRDRLLSQEVKCES